MKSSWTNLLLLGINFFVFYFLFFFLVVMFYLFGTYVFAKPDDKAVKFDNNKVVKWDTDNYLVVNRKGKKKKNKKGCDRARSRGRMSSNFRFVTRAIAWYLQPGVLPDDDALSREKKKLYSWYNSLILLRNVILDICIRFLLILLYFTLNSIY